MILFVNMFNLKVDNNKVVNDTGKVVNVTDNELNQIINYIEKNTKINHEENKIEETETVEFKKKLISNFDLNFLKLENQKENKVYSPLSIKYALKMLEEASNGKTKEQISKLLRNYQLTQYESSKNLSIANSFFIRNSFKNQIKENYMHTLKNTYDADIQFDSFENAKNINHWINEKTFSIIPEIVIDKDVKQLDFALVNAIGIDMEWKEKFLLGRYKEKLVDDNQNAYQDGTYVEYIYEQEKDHILDYEVWQKMTSEERKERELETNKKGINVYGIDDLSSHLFKNVSKETEVSGMWVYATINNYDIVNELGEENIKQIVGDEYRKFAKEEPYDTKHAGGDFTLSDDVTDSGIEKDLNEFLPKYISTIDSNYHKYGNSTEFSCYIDNDVKMFAKDLKEYNNTTLQYVGIMPIKKDLDQFITNLDNVTMNQYISNLKSINYENFKEGVVTRIYGFIPKFKFEYDLKLMEDLKLSGMTDVFDSNKADLSNMIDGDAYIDEVLHKANIEFSEDGIKAAAATFIGGYGAGEAFYYNFDVPIEYIDITFDKPYMFLIRDK